jgi:hypothetical protein
VSVPIFKKNDFLLIFIAAPDQSAQRGTTEKHVIINQKLISLTVNNHHYFLSDQIIERERTTTPVSK